ncbi:MAG: ABC transporter ATP-binding protein [Campylobacterales bacterium]
MEGMLQAVGLAHAFDYPLFDDLSLTLEAGSSTAILGPSGSGKSTLLHILSSFIKPNQGKVFYNDHSLYESSDAQLQKIRRKEFGIIFQHHYLFRGFSAEENLLVASLISGEQIDRSMLEAFGVGHLLKQPIQTLSGGQQQRISIARVLTKRPRIIFADEPTGNLDTTTASHVMQSVQEYIKQTGSSLFLVTHDERLAATCDVAYRLESGRLIRL